VSAQSVIAKEEDIFERKGLNLPTAIALAVIHIGAIAALFTFSWRALIVSVIFYWVTIGFGISLGYHRLHTHRSFVIPQWMDYLFALFGAMTLEGGPIFWVATHRIHHQKSDVDGDPHSPRDGAFWSHMGWILFGEAKHNNTRLMGKYAPDLMRHKFYVTLNNWHWLPTVVLAGILYLVSGLPMVLWAVCLRITVGLHATWLVNSATHMWGKRRFQTRDDSRNSWWVALLTFGEGWHNNHHAHPTSARHGLAWYEFDLSWLSLKVMRALGIAKNIKVAKLDSAMSERKAA
jgi:stearoyl-CoA desaturase (delta-9 desaturase)